MTFEQALTKSSAAENIKVLRTELAKAEALRVALWNDVQSAPYISKAVHEARCQAYDNACARADAIDFALTNLIDAAGAYATELE